SAADVRGHRPGAEIIQTVGGIAAFCEASLKGERRALGVSGCAEDAKHRADSQKFESHFHSPVWFFVELLVVVEKGHSCLGSYQRRLFVRPAHWPGARTTRKPVTKSECAGLP